jgi:hypothetical protein
MKKALIAGGVVLVILIGLVVIGMLAPKSDDSVKTDEPKDDVAQDTVTPEATPKPLMQMNITGGRRAEGAVYPVSRRVYDDGVILEQSSTKEVSLVAQLGDAEFSEFKESLAKLKDMGDIGTLKDETLCNAASDGLDYEFAVFDEAVTGIVDTCRYTIDLTTPLLAPFFLESGLN